VKPKVLLPVVFGLTLGLGIGILVTSMGLWWGVRAARAAIPSTVTTQQAADELKERLDLYSKRADDLERLLSLLIAVSTVYAIALSWNAFQQAKDSESKLDKIGGEIEAIREKAQREADKGRDEIEVIRQGALKEAEKVRDDVLKIFPVFEGMDDAIRSTMHKVMSLLPRIDLSEKKFESLQSRDREEILFYEKTMSASEYFNLRSFKKMTAEIYHGLGNFYALRCASETHLNELAAKDDRERARFYLDRALYLDDMNVGALNDRGYLSFALDDPPQPADAKTYYEISLKVGPNQQRARYNLALIKHQSKPPDYEHSIRLLTEALEIPRWQEQPDPRRVPDILYNRACSRTRLAERKGGEEQTSLLKDALADLKTAFDNKDIDWLTAGEPFLEDIKEGNDLTLLAKDGRFEGTIKEFEIRVRSKLGKPN
jgi:tetratricopeptide (TPR) repeat protein